MKNETPVQSFGSGGVTSQQQVWKVIGSLLLLSCSPLLSAPKIVPVDDPSGSQTTPAAINPQGVITGSYNDNLVGGFLGFIYTPGGKFTNFGPPDAAPSYPSVYPTAINPANVVTGWYIDVNTNTDRGFLRTPTGTITEFDSTSAVNGTLPFGINPSGTVTGFYYDQNFYPHGFLRTGGNFVEFDPTPEPPVTPTTVSFSFPEAINPAGEVTGVFFSYDTATGSNFQIHFFIREPNGNFIDFDPNDTLTSYPQPYNLPLMGINPAGDVTGYYIGSDNNYHGFIRFHNGTIISAAQFDPPGSTPPFVQAVAINPSAQTTGTYTGTDGRYHGFLRDKHANVATFDPTGSNFTIPTAINQMGAVIGYYYGPDGIHGFLRLP